MVNDWLYTADLSRKPSAKDGSIDDMAADRLDDLLWRDRAGWNTGDDRVCSGLI